MQRGLAFAVVVSIGLSSGCALFTGGKNRPTAAAECPSATCEPAPAKPIATTLAANGGLGVPEIQEIREARTRDRANKDQASSSDSPRTSQLAYRSVGQFTGRFAEIPSNLAGVKRVSCEYEVGNSKKVWHEVYGGCPNTWNGP